MNFYAFYRKQKNNPKQNRNFKMSSTFLNPLPGRRQRLVTYSQAGTRGCCKEQHENDGIYYHCALKLTGNKKWKSVKENISKKHNIISHFSDKYEFYISAYRHIRKEDTDVVHSQNHSNLPEQKNLSPKTEEPV